MIMTTKIFIVVFLSFTTINFQKFVVTHQKIIVVNENLL